MRNPIERLIRITYNNIKSSVIQYKPYKVYYKVYWKMAKEDRGWREGLKFH